MDWLQITGFKLARSATLAPKQDLLTAAAENSRKSLMFADEISSSKTVMCLARELIQFLENTMREIKFGHITGCK